MTGNKLSPIKRKYAPEFHAVSVKYAYDKLRMCNGSFYAEQAHFSHTKMHQGK